MSGGLACLSVSTSARSPNEPSARIRSTGAPSGPAWLMLIWPVESARPQRITSVVTVNGPGVDAVMK